jgi:hypothetical protein
MVADRRPRREQATRSLSPAPGGDAKPVAVRVYEVAFPPGQPFFIDGNPELLGLRLVGTERFASSAICRRLGA